MTVMTMDSDDLPFEKIKHLVDGGLLELIWDDRDGYRVLITESGKRVLRVYPIGEKIEDDLD